MLNWKMGGRKCFLIDTFAASNVCVAFCSIILLLLAASSVSSFPSTPQWQGHNKSVMFCRGCHEHLLDFFFLLGSSVHYLASVSAFLEGAISILWWCALGFLPFGLLFILFCPLLEFRFEWWFPAASRKWELLWCFFVLRMTILTPPLVFPSFVDPPV